MKIYTLIGGLTLLAGLAYGCNHKKETRDTLSDLKVLTTDIARETVEVPQNLGALVDAAHDLRYVNGPRATRNLSRIDFQRNSEPLQDHRMKAALTRDAHALTKDFDQNLEDLDLLVEHAYHTIGLQ